MPSSPDAQAAWNGLMHSAESGRLSHAYLLSGSSLEALRHFSGRLLQLIFCQEHLKPCGHCSGCRRVNLGTHPDLFRIEPRSKSRQIVVDDVEPLLIHLQQTAFEGGMKAAVLDGADRMNPSVANKMLKTLEEPTDHTLILLLSTQPDTLLPTIVSRCQRVWVPPGDAPAGGEAWRGEVLELLRRGWPVDPLAAASVAAHLTAMLKQERERAAVEETAQAEEGVESKVLEARVSARGRAVRQQVLTMALDWQRDVLLLNQGVTDAALLRFSAEAETLQAQAAELNYTRAMGRVRRCERMAELLERNLSEPVVFERGFSPV